MNVFYSSIMIWWWRNSEWTNFTFFAGTKMISKINSLFSQSAGSHVEQIMWGWICILWKDIFHDCNHEKSIQWKNSLRHWWCIYWTVYFPIWCKIQLKSLCSWQKEQTERLIVFVEIYSIINSITENEGLIGFQNYLDQIKINSNDAYFRFLCTWMCSWMHYLWSMSRQGMNVFKSFHRVQHLWCHMATWHGPIV